MTQETVVKTLAQLANELGCAESKVERLGKEFEDAKEQLNAIKTTMLERLTGSES